MSSQKSHNQSQSSNLQDYRRAEEWDKFSAIVRQHIIDYTIPQYGDKPDDEVEHWTEEQCIKAISKYVKRHGMNLRGQAEESRDKLKIAHFACMAFFKEDE